MFLRMVFLESLTSRLQATSRSSPRAFTEKMWCQEVDELAEQPQQEARPRGHGAIVSRIYKIASSDDLVVYFTSDGPLRTEVACSACRLVPVVQACELLPSYEKPFENDA
mmetsp:Transcript_113063/g.177883  ORF Transcript_113063/g.177883 Transcript_113063/m.177883 type:complete len:110 (-) Transcript_113063:1047-1376(-)